ncbi:protein FAM3C [Entelurus aequoreus]|uniref:protein FAM3C n=1 Tax=Entelurus aequoreus TaxID=161455 RepID=UPI002B1DD715|nr:protein FAM3C [Entelurus aequoreus]
MRHKAATYAAALVVLVLTWNVSKNVWQGARQLLGVRSVEQTKVKVQPETSSPKCGLSRLCPPQHFAVHVRSGAADVVGPKICFDGQIIMSHVLNNVGPGLNIVVINGVDGAVDKSGYLNMKDGVPEDILAYLKAIKSGDVVIVASFDDVTTKLTEEMKEIFVNMGSTLITSLRYRDNWVFAGRGRAGNISSFEKRVANQRENNAYEDWPAAVEVGGCFPTTA